MKKDNEMLTDLMRYQESCSDFIEEGLITDFLHVIKKGKEAVVVCCRAHPDTGETYAAVKLYREKKFRNFKRDQVYMQGRIWDQRMLRAIRKRSQTAERSERSVWVETEFTTLATLQDTSVRAPRPLGCTNDALAMAFVGIDDEPAPLLRQIEFENDRAARRCFDKIIDDIRVMLQIRIVHSDLSPYNIMFHDGEPWLIDFPQAIDPTVNPDAFVILERDVSSIVRFFGAWGIDYDSWALAAGLWKPVFGPI